MLEIRKSRLFPNQLISRFDPHGGRQGFALVIALGLMAFILLLLLSITTFVRVESRNAEQTTKVLAARSNALLALNVALGELQKASGADRRITASSDIVNSNGYLNDDRDDAKRHWTGVWSTENYLDSELVSRNRAPRTLNPEKDLDLDAVQEDGFQGWLVSYDRDSGMADDIDDAFGGFSQPAEDLVTLVGPGTIDAGTVGSAGATNSYVRVPKIPIGGSGNAEHGKIAWWVGDEGVKARLDRADPHRESGNESQRLRSLAAAQRVGLEMFSNQLDPESATAGDFLSLDPADQEPQRALAKPIDLSAAGLVDPLLEPLDDYRFHDATFFSEGLFTDVKYGGLRRDLSLAFEMPLELFNDQPEFGSGYDAYGVNTTGGEGNRGITELDFDFSPLFEFTDFDNSPNVRGRAVYRGPAWQLLRSHYRLYKDVNDDLSILESENGYYPGKDFGLKTRNSDGTVTRVVQQIGFSAIKINSPDRGYLSHRHGYDTPASTVERNGDPLGTRVIPDIMPVMTRFAFFVSVRPKSNGRLEMIMDPAVVLWNPYNVELEFSLSGNPLKASFQNMPMEVRVFFDKGEKTSDDTAESGPFINTFEMKEIFGGLYRPAFSSTSGTVVLGPGELRVFAGNGQGAGALFDQGLVYNLSEEGGRARELELTNDSGEALRLTPESRVAFAFTWEPGVESFFNLFQQVQGYQDVIGQATFVALDADSITGSNLYSEGMDVSADATGSLYWPIPDRSFSLTDPNGYIAEDNFKYYQSSGGDPYISDISGKESIGVVDLYLKAAGENPSFEVQMLNHFNPRAPTQFVGYDINGGDLRTAGAYPSPSDNWRVKYFRNENWTSTQAGGLTAENGFWGENHTAGVSQVVLFDLPSRPILSLGSFQHLSTGVFVDQPAFAIGNAYPSPFIPIDKIHATTTFGSGSTYSRTDVSYLANEALWDSYFFSGLAEDIGAFQQTLSNRWDDFARKQSETLGENSNITLALPEGVTAADASVALFNSGPRADAYEKIGTYIRNKGAFNINSTSVEAWRTLLASTNGLAVPVAGQGDESRSGSALSRVGAPVQPSLEGGGDEWGGFRRLASDEVDELARAIVEEVKRRGPFASLADFINRRLGASDETELRGALQAAIDATDINSHMSGSFQAGAAGPNFLPENANFTPTSAAATTYLTQADLLQTISPLLTARSDTFRIRAYGEAETSVTGEPGATAVCEAIVQRTADYIDPADQPETPSFTTPTLTSPVNEDFGRRYRIVAFRWLGADEM